ncbi:hypothetical protein AYO44_10925 [Planctomycetaceae bacterium SCGC AG-212-F19]|nr:hypothetical protein AYO44_10925 [Planctomycetaceae bacterium SCGC AG-212-F19]
MGTRLIGLLAGAMALAASALGQQRPQPQAITDITKVDADCAVQGEYVGTITENGAAWGDATGFCQKLSHKTDRQVVLPTEAQWEFACRAGMQTRFFHGDDEKLLPQYVLFWARTDLPVGQFKPNAWGLHGMLGNRHEWCADLYGPYGDNAQTDPTSPAEGTERVLRGGSFHNSAKFCRCASRIHYPPAQADYDFGFHIAVRAAASDKK